MSSLYNWIAPILQRHPASLVRLDRGWVPIVDMMNAPNALISEREIGKVNGWEIYFEQPCGRSLADAAGSRSVVMSYVGATLDRPYQTPAFVMKPDPHLQAWRRLARKTIRFKPETASYLEKVSSSALDDGKSLGVLCRGTDYTALRPSRHPVQPSVEQVIDKAAETMRTHRCSILFLATEDETVHARFKARFGDALRRQAREYPIAMERLASKAGFPMSAMTSLITINSALCTVNSGFTVLLNVRTHLSFQSVVKKRSDRRLLRHSCMSEIFHNPRALSMKAPSPPV